ncbi:MAG: GNAT family N-acetyltransferase [Candidatus Binataceae bacterium]
MADNLGLTAIDPRDYLVTERLRDGGTMRIRAIRPDDQQRLRWHFESLSAQARYFRFFGERSTLAQADLAYFTELDFVRHVGLAATVAENGLERFIGVGRYFRGEDARAEIALAVLDQHQGRGIGSLLIKHLALLAGQAGIVEFVADVMGGNRRVLEFLRRRGCVIHHTNASGIIHFTLRCAESFSAATRRS